MKIVVLLVSLLAFLLVFLSGPLYQFEVIGLGAVFLWLKYGVYAAIAALALLLIQVLFVRKTVSWTSAGATVLLSVMALALPLSMLNKARTVPPIHDISTDVADPPQFVAIAPLRADAPNPVAYAGADAAKQQRRAYPDLQTLYYAQSKSDLLEAAQQAAKDLGWQIVNVDEDRGLIEATDATVWFGFKDDVVIRIEDTQNQRVIDIRSKSRVGGSDLGKNAERIERFIERLDEILTE